MKYEVIVTAIGGLLIGCSLGGVEVTTTGQVVQLSEIDNGLNFNSIIFNRGVFSSLSSRPIAIGRTTSGQLIFNSVADVESTSAGRELLHYVAQCALSSTEVLLVEHDGLQYSYSGLFGGAPDWEYRDLTHAEKELVSGCLLAHVNAYGVAVHISVRAPEAIEAEPAELVSHPVYEGTFYGDLFGNQLKLFACTGSSREIAMQHSPDRIYRACTDPSTDCEIVVTGRCRDVCDRYSDKYGWQGCVAEGHRYEETVSVFLRDPNEDDRNQTCGVGENCQFSVEVDDAIFDCSDAGACDSKCEKHSTCTVDANAAAVNLTLTWGNSMSETNCQSAGECVTACLFGSECEVDCWNAEQCSGQFCAAGARCLLDCTGALSCGFGFCMGGETTCANDVVVCNRPCPS